MRLLDPYCYLKYFVLMSAWNQTYASSLALHSTLSTLLSSLQGLTKRSSRQALCSCRWCRLEFATITARNTTNASFSTRWVLFSPVRFKRYHSDIEWRYPPCIFRPALCSIKDDFRMRTKCPPPPSSLILCCMACQILSFNQQHPHLCMRWLSAPLSQLVIERRVPASSNGIGYGNGNGYSNGDTSTAIRPARATAAAPLERNEAAAADDLSTIPIFS